MQKLIKSDNPVPEGDSFQIFLGHNQLRGIFNWDNPEHVALWHQWKSEVPTFKPWQPMGISPTNGSFNHY